MKTRASKQSMDENDKRHHTIVSPPPSVSMEAGREARSNGTEPEPMTGRSRKKHETRTRRGRRHAGKHESDEMTGWRSVEAYGGSIKQAEASDEPTDGRHERRDGHARSRPALPAARRRWHRVAMT